MCVWCRLVIAAAVLAGLQKANAEGTDGSEHSDPLPSVPTGLPVDPKPPAERVELHQTSPPPVEPVATEEKVLPLLNSQVIPESKTVGSSSAHLEDTVVKNAHTITAKDFAERTASATAKKLAKEKAMEAAAAAATAATKYITTPEIEAKGEKGSEGNPISEKHEQNTPDDSGKIKPEPSPEVGPVALPSIDAIKSGSEDASYVEEVSNTGTKDGSSQDVNLNSNVDSKPTVSISVNQKPQENENSHITAEDTATTVVDPKLDNNKKQEKEIEDKIKTESSSQDYKEESSSPVSKAPLKSSVQETAEISLENTEKEGNQLQNGKVVVEGSIVDETEEKSSKGNPSLEKTNEMPDKILPIHPDELQPSETSHVKDTVDADERKPVDGENTEKKTELNVKLVDIIKTVPPTLPEIDKTIPALPDANLKPTPEIPEEIVNPTPILSDENVTPSKNVDPIPAETDEIVKPEISDGIAKPAPLIADETVKSEPPEAVNHVIEKTSEIVSPSPDKGVDTLQPLPEILGETPQSIPATTTETNVPAKTGKDEHDSPAESAPLVAEGNSESTNKIAESPKEIIPPVMTFTIEEVTPANKEEYTSAFKDQSDTVLEESVKNKESEEVLKGISLNDASKKISEELKAYSNNVVLAWDQKSSSVGWTGEAVNVLKDYMEKISISQQAHNLDCVKTDIEKHEKRLKSLQEVIKACESGLERADWKELQDRSKEILAKINEIVEEANTAISQLPRDDPGYIYERGVIENAAKRKLVELDTDSIKDTFSKLAEKSLKKDEEDLKTCLNGKNEKEMVSDTLIDIMRIKDCVG